MKRFIVFFEHFDWLLFFAVLSLTAFGCLLIYSIGISQDQSSFLRFDKQLIAATLGLALGGFLVWIDYRHARSFSLIGYLVGAILLLAVVILGRRVNGTVGWFEFGSFTFQPVELAKVSLILYLSAFFSRRARGQLTWKMFALSGLATSFYVGLVLLQPDLGSALVMIGSWLILCLFIGLPRRAWWILPLTGLIIGGLTWQFALQPYQRDRIFSFMDYSHDTQDVGYNARQARIAIGSGGWLGKGLGEGSQARLRFLPEASTDFIFSVLGEELGFAGTSITLLLYALVIGRLLWIGWTSEDDFAALFLVGTSGILMIHVFVNGGMNLGILPITGIPMPFLSAAASSLLSLSICIGLAESIAIRRRSIG
ncbi:rod shape-determining protein RodA [Patescibacteria group bacterium]|nr:rod shape-determining protein RodA [Patescibacteria group bacterium]